MPRIVLFPIAAIALLIGFAPMPAGADGARGDDRQSVAFTVAGIVYHAVSPGHSLRAAVHKALLRYAAPHHYPRWTADGPFAVDP